MPRATRAKCYCGCGQAPGTSCRQRLLSCSVCCVKVRMSREGLASVTLSCSCGGVYVPHCLEDRARAGDSEADARIAAMPLLKLPTHKSSRGAAGRWWCVCCSAFVAGESSECAKCRDRGPHHFGEDAPTTGNAARRARLRAAQRKRNANRYSLSAPTSATRARTDDLPF